MIRNVLFFQIYSVDPIKGGVARVCYNLAEGFKNRGLNVYSLSLDNKNYNAFSACYTLPDGNSVSKTNTNYLEAICKRLNIDVIINAYPNEGWTSKLLQTLKGKVIIISHYHNSPFNLNSHVGFLDIKQLSDIKWIKVLAFYIQRYRHKQDNHLMMEVCDKMVLLSNAFEDEINSLVKFPNEKLIAIPNPILPLEGCTNNSVVAEKENVLLFVGRVSEKQKRIHSLLNIWASLYKHLPDWRLEIVGGGDELDYWEKQAAMMGLERYSFEGFTDPNDYYDRAKILLMTSNYEGFPMVLVEAMQHGCIPFAFNSYASLQDIIDDGENGFTVQPFNEQEYADKILNLINTPNKMNDMSFAAIKKAKKFDLCSVVDKWHDLFNEICQ